MLWLSVARGASDQRLGRRLDGDGLLNQAVEELASVDLRRLKRKVNSSR